MSDSSSKSSSQGLLDQASIDNNSPRVNGTKRDRRMRSVPGASHYQNGHQDKKVHANPNGGPIFVQKTYEMVETTHDDLACWSPDGTCFVIKDPELFEQTIVPKFFDHKNFSSFERQLNFYGFRKLQSGIIYKKDAEKESAKHLAFYHEKFQRGKPHLLTDIIRSTNPRSKQNQKDAQSKRISELERLVELLLQKQEDMQSEMSELKSGFASLQNTVLRMQNLNQQPIYQQQNQIMTAPTNKEIDTRSTWYYHPTNSNNEKVTRVADTRLNSLGSKYINDPLAIGSNQKISAPRVDSDTSTNSDSSLSVTDILFTMLDDPQSNKGNCNGTESADPKVSQSQEENTTTARPDEPKQTIARSTHYNPNGNKAKIIDSTPTPQTNTNTFTNSNSNFNVTDIFSTLQPPSSLQLALNSPGESQFILDDLLRNKDNFDGTEPADAKVFFKSQEEYTSTARPAEPKQTIAWSTHYNLNGGIHKTIDSTSAPQANTNTSVNSNSSLGSGEITSLSQFPPLLPDRQMSQTFDKMRLRDDNQSKP